MVHKKRQVEIMSERIKERDDIFFHNDKSQSEKTAV